MVDNGSTDGSVRLIREQFPEIELVLVGANIGFAAANLGARRAADCDWLALLNPDAFPEPGWLAALVQAARENPQFSGIGSHMRRAGVIGELDGTGDVYQVGGMAWRRDNGRPDSIARERGEIFSPCAAAALYSRALFVEAGGFDERYFAYYEDTDLAFRLRLRGHSFLYEPAAVVDHVGFAAAGAETPFTAYHSQRNIVWTYAKNMPAPLFWTYLPQHLLVNLLNVAWYTLRGQGRAVLRAKRDAVLGLPGILRTRREVQRGRTVGSLELRRRMAGGLGPYTRPRCAHWRPGEQTRARQPAPAPAHGRSGRRPLHVGRTTCRLEHELPGARTRHRARARARQPRLPDALPRCGRLRPVHHGDAPQLSVVLFDWGSARSSFVARDRQHLGCRADPGRP
jgi:GT2 family glycosyltransferase